MNRVSVEGFIAVFLIVTCYTPVRGDFILTVKFINYTNPTGLCAECRNRVDNVTNATQLVPVCCDELPFKTDNCSNTEDICDTRFRWAIRPFGASLETRPNGCYFFTPCPQSSTTCPFSEMSKTFGQGNSSFLGVAANPLPVSSREAISRGQPALVPWTGRIQFFIESVDSELPNIIDSLLVNLDNLQLGAAFTEEMTFTGFHNISHMTMSFRVECAPGFCGDDCLSTPASNRWIAECQANGDFICINSGLNPLPSTLTSPGCTSCLHNLDISTDCTSCLEANFDPATNCTACFQEYNITSNCTSCLEANFDPATNCSLCLQPDLFTDTDCTVCTTPGGDPTTFCETCLPNFNLATNCTECTANYDLTTNCSSCLPGYDSSTGCIDCLPGRYISTNCTECLSGFTRVNCEPVAGGPDTGLVGGVIGGVLGVLLVVVILLLIIVCVLVCRRGQTKFSVSDERTAINTYAYNTSTANTGTGSSPNHKFQNPLYSSGLELDSKPGTGTSEDHQFSNSLYESATATREEESSQLHQPVKTATTDFTTNSNSPNYDTTYPEDGQPMEDTPVYDKTNYGDTSKSLSSVPVDQQYSHIHHTVEPLISTVVYDSANFTSSDDPSVVYDEAFPSSNPSNQRGTNPPSAAPVHSTAGQPQTQAREGTPVYDTADHRDTAQLLPSNMQPEEYSQLQHPSNGETLKPQATIYDSADHGDPAVYDEAFPGNPSRPYEEIADKVEEGKPLGVYDTTYPATPMIPSDNAYSKLGRPEPELPVYDVTHHDTQPPHLALPPSTDIYDTADYPDESETKQAHDYLETKDFLSNLDETPKAPATGPTYKYEDTSQFPASTSSAKRNAYDYIDNSIDTATSLPPQVNPPNNPVYTNTIPGKITAKAESHYDFGQ